MMHRCCSGYKGTIAQLEQQEEQERSRLEKDMLALKAREKWPTKKPEHEIQVKTANIE